jgi:tetratricopeptide (TPR) repeat protein
MGTGFLVSDTGFVVTNKHVAQPWKIDTLAQALSIKESTQQGAFLSVERYLWFAGQKFRYSRDDLAFGNAFASTEQENLYLLSTPVDQWVYETVGEVTANMGAQQGQTGFSRLGLGADDLVRCVELGGDDLAVLWVKATPQALPEPLQLGSDASMLRRLDKVLLLGFPSGVQELEGMSATPTSMLADVRKVQESIHITTGTAHGNSGGPLLSAEGKVMGVLSKYLSQGNPTSFSCIKTANLRSFAPYLFYKETHEIVEHLVEIGAFHPADHTMEVHQVANKTALQTQLTQSYEREMTRFLNYLVFYLSQPVAGGRRYWDRMGFIQSVKQVGVLPLKEDTSDDKDPFTDLLLTPRTNNAWRKLKGLYRSASRSGKLANAELLEPDTALELSRNYFQAIQAMGGENEDSYPRYRDRIGRLYRKHSHFFCASHYWGSLLWRESRWDAAIPVLKKTLDLYPRLFRKHQGGIYLTTLNNLGWCYFQKQQFRTAITTYKRVLRECHNDWIALNNIAMCHLYLGHDEKAADYAERATMSGRAKDRAHAYFTLARVYSGGLDNQKQALRCLKRAIGLGLRRPIKQVRASQHLKQLRVNEEFQALTHFDYGFRFEEQWMHHDVHITNRSGFPWTNVTIMLAVDGAKPKLQSSARMDPGRSLTLQDVTSTDLRDIRKLELLIYCDQGVWKKRPN